MADTSNAAARLDFSGRTALVTGAASGIGRAVAKWLDRQGIEALVLVDLDGNGLASLDLSCQVRSVVGDVSDPAIWNEVETGLVRLDHAVINAGCPPSGSELIDTSFEDWRRVVGVHLDGAFLGMQCAMRKMREGGGGSIVLTSSAAALRALSGTGDYAVSKAGVVHMARIAGLEGAKHGIRVNSIAPGGTDTGIWDAQPGFQEAVAAKGGDREAVIAEMGTAGTPRGEWATAEEMADSIGFLLSGMAANLTGSLIVSDGGITL